MIMHIFWFCLIVFLVPMTIFDTMSRGLVAAFWVCTSLGILATSNVESLVDRWYDRDGRDEGAKYWEDQKEFCRRLHKKLTIEIKATDHASPEIDALVEDLFKHEPRNVSL